MTKSTTARMWVAAACATALASGSLSAQQTQQAPQPFAPGPPIGVTVEGRFEPLSANVKVFGGLVNAESCVYDAARGLIVVVSRGANQNVTPNDAFVTLLNHDGSVHTPKFIGATRVGLVLNQPFGSEIWNGKLYVADRDGGTSQTDPSINVVRAFDLATGAPAGEFRIPESVGFNDLAIAPDGTIYGTQTSNPMRVYRIRQDGSFDVLVEGAPLNQPNGIALDGRGNLVVVNYGNMDVLTYSPTGQLLATEQALQPAIDGIVIMPDGTKYVNGMRNGGISMLRPGRPAELIATGIPGGASMCYDSAANQLVVPLPGSNSVALVPLR